ncbi:MAG: HEPN domain-containing protein [Euryarchaeota archaeon]|nr:HEPN domain-containing protein [Euryarchaeota archaeon]
MNKVGESLLERAEKYLKSAGLLADADDYESSVSRAYYAMFFAAEAALLSKGLSPASHGGVLSVFGEHFVKTGVFPRSMGRALNRAYAKRQLGDYEHRFVISSREAKEVLADAAGFVKEISRYLVAKGD